MEIISAVNMLNQSTKTENYKKEIDEKVSYQMDRIKKACEQGLTFCVFSVGCQYEDDIKSLFKAQGYWFRPYGLSGGVWQDCENICWGAR